jgi:hypothetical protein
MTPAQAQALVTSTSSLGMVSEILLALQVQILLLQKQTGNTMTATQLVTTAGTQFGNVTDILTALQCIICLQAQGSSGLSGIGSPQGVVTAAAGTTYVNTSNGNLWVNTDGTITGWTQIVSGSVSGLSGSGSPQGVVTASPGTTYTNVSTGDFWVKQTGIGTNTGWTLIVAA